MVTGRFEFVHNVRVPGMLHGRVVRPPSATASVASVDRSSIDGMDGLVRVVVKTELRRRGGGEAMAGDSGGCQVEGCVGDGPGAATAARSARASARPDVDARHARCRFRRRGRCAIRNTHGRPRHVSLPVPDARVRRNGVRGCRRAGREGDDLGCVAGGVAASQLDGSAARAPARQRARDLQAGSGLLRDQRRGYGGLRCGAACRRQSAGRFACS